MTANTFFTWSKQKNVKTFSIARSEGSYWITEDGDRILDFSSTSFQTSFGHNNSLIKEKIKQQLDAFPVAYPKSTFSLKEKCTKDLLDLLGLEGKVFYTVSGAESVENALKIARKVTGRKIILSRERSYHGGSLGAMSVSGDWRTKGNLSFSEGTAYIPEFEDDPHFEKGRAIIEKIGSDQIAAFCLETIPGTNGVRFAPSSWWQGIQKACDDFGILLICDEVFMGFYRTGTPFAFQGLGIKPDFVTLGKGITGGYVPFGGVFVSKEVANYFDDETLVCGLTNFGHPLGLAALSGVIEIISSSEFKSHFENLARAYGEAMEGLREIQKVKDVRFLGLVGACELTKPIPDLYSKFIEKKVHLVSKNEVFFPGTALNGSLEDLKRGFELIKEVLNS